VVTASYDDTARLWDAKTGQPIGNPMKHAGAVNSAQFSPDGQRVVTVSSDGTARLWDAETCQAIGAPMRHGKDVVSAQFSPDSRRVSSTEVRQDTPGLAALDEVEISEIDAKPGR
jgi:WD40 repeat protein